MNTVSATDNPTSDTPMASVVSTMIDLCDVQQQIQAYYAELLSFSDDLKMVMHNYESISQLNNDMKSNEDRFIEQKTTLVLKLRSSFKHYVVLEQCVICKLNDWRHQQALAGNGGHLPENRLEEIQVCFELLESYVCQLLAAVKQFMLLPLINAEDLELSRLVEQVQCAQKNLVCSAFIVDKQPPQVLRTRTRFTASVRWLLGKHSGSHMNPPTVECVIMSELQARHFVTQRLHTDMSNSSMAPQSSGEIQNGSSSLEYQQSSNIWSANFGNMILKKVRRCEKKGTESIVDEKFALFFYAKATVNDYQIHVWTLSLPMVVISFSVLEPRAWATILWCNAFADIVRDPFMVANRVTWAQLSETLNTKFGSYTERALTAENLEYLHEKLQACDHTECVSWNQFCKEPLPDRTFTFWEWFFAIRKLTKDCLLGMWAAGRITGFISKTKAEHDLLRAPTGVGTFLVRFSDTVLGGVSVIYVNDDRKVIMMSPWVTNDLIKKSLADRIRDLDMLCCLYSTDINVRPMKRDEAFGMFYSKSADNSIA